MTGAFRPTVAEINLDALTANYRVLRGLTKPEDFFCPMVKADAYGHGAIEVTRELRKLGAGAVGVALIEEGLQLRKGGDQRSILVFGLFSDRSSAEALRDFSLTPVASDWSQLSALESVAAGSQPMALHFKFNTGMNRLGFAVSEAQKLRNWLDRNRQFKLEGICTHLLRGGDANSEAGSTKTQLLGLSQAAAAFRDLRSQVHALNSGAMAALAKSPSSYGARPGIALYGAQPAADQTLRLPLAAVMELRSQIVHINRVPRGEVVSYGGTWKSAQDSLVGVIPVGYADGYKRTLSNKGSVLCRGRRAPVVGTVCMDYFMIDLTEITRASGEVGVGERVTLIGEQDGARITVEEIADLAGTISYEVFTGVGSRVPRIFKRSEG